jgi:ubiquinone/menaquinone biosynthesis C-methylase UbiE
VASESDYTWKLEKEAEFWGTMARLRGRDGIPMTMDFTRATCYRVRRADLGWGDYYQDPRLEALTPFGRARIRFVKAARATSGTRVLDLCCGAGWLALEHARAGKRVDAADLSAEEISVAKQYQATLPESIPGHINWIVTDLNKFNVDPGSYELVTAWDGLHHIEAIDRLCGQMAGGLKAGGRFMMSERVWGGDRPSVRARIGKYLEQLLWTLLPTYPPSTYPKKFKALFATYKAFFDSKVLRRRVEPTQWQLQPTEAGLCSPFEDASGAEMMDAIRIHFAVEKMETYGGFTEDILRTLYLPRLLRWPVILILAWLDHLVVRLGLLEGKIMILYGRKKD